MAGGSTEKPAVRCLIARKLDPAARTVGRSRLVSLQTAYIALRSGGWVAIGPDPEDMETLAAWERDQAPFNGLKLP